MRVDAPNGSWVMSENVVSAMVIPKWEYHVFGGDEERNKHLAILALSTGQKMTFEFPTKEDAEGFTRKLSKGRRAKTIN